MSTKKRDEEVAQYPKHNFIFLDYLDDDGELLDEELGEVPWQEGRADGEGVVCYVRIKKVGDLLGELRQFVINHEIKMDDCSAWGELEALVGTKQQGRLVFAAAKEKETA